MFLPRTLFGRNLLLMAALILFAEVGMILVFRQTVQEPRTARLIEFAQTHVHAIRSALAVMTPEQRQRYLGELGGDGAARITQAGASPVQFAEARRPIVHLFIERLGARLGPGYRLGWQESPERRIWVGTSLGAQDYWLSFEAGTLIGSVTPLFVGLALGAGGLALLGAYLIQRRINRPLRSLAAAAAGVGRGRIEMPRLENAPTEIAQVAASFIQMAADLEAAERERALMLAGVSHDLRTPLAKLRLATEILAPGADQDLIASMVRNIAAADAVIDQFIDFARLGSDEALRTCDLNEMARDVAAAAGAGRVRLTLADLPPYVCRPVALRRALANLVENALRYADGTIELRSGMDGGEIRLSVLDAGPGIPQADLERMRQPFTRLDAARSGRPGAGLGLAIVERIARLHRGELLLRNRAQGGLEAVLVLPADGAVDAAAHDLDQGQAASVAQAAA